MIVSLIERGEANPSIETLWRVAQALGVPLGTLLSEPEEAAVRAIPKESGASTRGRSGMRGWLIDASAEARAAAAAKPAIVDITMHMQEGEQFFVNRITFVGNNTTRDHVIRREMNLVENGIFNTEALKHSVKRLNQLGYFKQLEGNEAIKVEKTPQEKNQVDVTLKLEEQNRNQLQFGAGYSQYEGTLI